MKAALLLLAAAAVSAQQYSPSPELREYLSLTNAQVEAIEKGYAAYLAAATAAQQRWYAAYDAFLAEKRRNRLDPSALGRRYVEIEQGKRELDKIYAAAGRGGVEMTPAQTVKLRGLADLQSRMPLAGDAVCAAMVEEGPPYTNIPASPSFSLGGSIAVLSLASGCYGPPGPSLAIILLLDLTDRQTAWIAANHAGFERWRSERTARSNEVSLEVYQLAQMAVLDAETIGIRQAEIETIDREIRSEQSKYARQSRTVLTAAQAAILAPLITAQSLRSIIAEAAAVGLLRQEP